MCENTSSKALSMKAMHLSHMMRMLHEEKMRDTDPRASPGRVLAFLRLAEEVSVGDMTMILEVRPHSLEKTLAMLEEDGFVAREQGEKRWLDKVRLTEKGLQPGKRPEGRASKVFGTLSEEARTARGDTGQAERRIREGAGSPRGSRGAQGLHAREGLRMEARMRADARMERIRTCAPLARMRTQVRTQDVTRRPFGADMEQGRGDEAPARQTSLLFIAFLIAHVLLWLSSRGNKTIVVNTRWTLIKDVDYRSAYTAQMVRAHHKTIVLIWSGGIDGRGLKGGRETPSAAFHLLFPRRNRAAPSMATMATIPAPAYRSRLPDAPPWGCSSTVTSQ